METKRRLDNAPGYGSLYLWHPLYPRNESQESGSGERHKS